MAPEAVNRVIHLFCPTEYYRLDGIYQQARRPS
jgi:hypothetical protein